MGGQIASVGVRGRAGDGLVAVVDQRDELADLLGDLIGLWGRPRLVVTGIANRKFRIERVWQALMGGHGPKDMLNKL
jgi:hypothetical protein